MRKINSVAIFLLVAYSANSLAQTISSTMTVSVLIGNACMVTANNLTFGRFDPLKPISPSNGQAQTNVYINCIPGIDYNVYLSAGNSANFSTRYMAGGSGNPDKVNYNLYTDPSFINIWGDQTQSYDVGTGTGAQQAYIVYGQIDGGQAPSVRPDNYNDTIQVNVTY